MIDICAHYCGTVILLKQVETEEEATEFIKHGCYIPVGEEEDEWIYPDEMFIEYENLDECLPI